VHLPLGGDVWRPYQFDEQGQIIPRTDNVSAVPGPVLEARSPDVQAILMAELDAARAELEAAKQS
jgi:hypothetical protein